MSPGGTSTKPSPAAAISSGPGSPRQPIAGTPRPSPRCRRRRRPPRSRASRTACSGAPARAPAAGVELAVEVDAVGHPQARRERLPARRARGRRRRSSSAASGGAAPSTASARSTSAWRLRATRWATVTSVGARPRRGGRVRRAAVASPPGSSAPRCTTRVSPRAVARAQLGDARGCWRAPAGPRRGRAPPPRARAAAPGRVEHVAAVHRDDQRHARARRGAPRRRRARRCGRGSSSNGNERAAAAARAPSGGRRPRPPARVAALARRRDVGHVGDRAGRRATCRRGSRSSPRSVARGAAPGPSASAARGGTSRCSTSTRTSAPASRAASAWRCAQTPEHRVAAARVELGDDRDPRAGRVRGAHQRRWVARVRAASRGASGSGRSARNARASATAASRA